VNGERIEARNLPRPRTIFVVEADDIYRAGMIVCLGALPEIDCVAGCARCEEAVGQRALADCDLAIVSIDDDDPGPLISRVHNITGGRVLATATTLLGPRAREAVEAGAVGLISKAGLSAESFVAQVRAALHGAAVVPAHVLPSLVGQADGRVVSGGLSSREQVVLQLLADGKLTREVAAELSYSERTVKAVLRDAVIKLGARSRSQAIAYAVREGLI
jgi:DNA-binding NarL/FixJ family response regulator